MRRDRLPALLFAPPMAHNLLHVGLLGPLIRRAQILLLFSVAREPFHTLAQPGFPFLFFFIIFFLRIYKCRYGGPCSNAASQTNSAVARILVLTVVSPLGLCRPLINQM